jgi:hypothetical protein
MTAAQSLSSSWSARGASSPLARYHAAVGAAARAVPAAHRAAVAEFLDRVAAAAERASTDLIDRR